MSVGVIASRSGTSTRTGNNYCNAPAYPSRCVVSVSIPDIAGSQKYTFSALGNWYGHPDKLYSSSVFYF